VANLEFLHLAVKSLQFRISNNKIIKTLSLMINHYYYTKTILIKGSQSAYTSLRMFYYVFILLLEFFFYGKLN